MSNFSRHFRAYRIAKKRVTIHEIVLREDMRMKKKILIGLAILLVLGVLGTLGVLVWRSGYDCEYTLLEDGTAELSIWIRGHGFTFPLYKAITIPATVDGYPVTSISVSSTRGRLL